MGTEGPTALLDPLRRGLPALATDALSGSATCVLPPRHEAVRTARDFTHRTLQRWEIARDLDEVALVVSELVTNALRHGLGTPAGARPEGAPQGVEHPVRLQLIRWSARLVCAVRDPGEASPKKAAHAPGPPPALWDYDADALAADLDGGPSPDAFLASGTTAACSEATAESGRGLFLVESFSDHWGWHRLTGTRPGKVVWAMFRFTPRP
ncbi:ATP-binding protein [Streptomyces sp. TR06-5]|uniref:ATP-binding protein n=1 Tax=Streptomyces sp. TR06-5 TaxID=3385976 RepID=UPI0039A3444D